MRTNKRTPPWSPRPLFHSHRKYQMYEKSRFMVPASRLIQKYSVPRLIPRLFEAETSERPPRFIVSHCTPLHDAFEPCLFWTSRSNIR